jgi:PAS domain-containing protein
VEDNRPGRVPPAGSARANGMPTPLTPGALADAQALIADELPDGLVVADDTGRVVVFNRAAARLTGLAAEQAIGKYVFDALHFRDEDGRDWWVCSDPYNGLATRTRHPERSLYLAWSSRCGARSSGPGSSAAGPSSSPPWRTSSVPR